jgi:UDP-N-acetylmuramoylalanine--D-glutamate ligase
MNCADTKRPASSRGAGPDNEAGREIPLAGRRVVVAGLARSGMAAVRFLASRGARVVASDHRKEDELGRTVDEARALGVELDLGAHSESVFTAADLIVASPGVPLALPVMEAAREHGVPIIAEVELAARFLRGRIAGITGSNGKSTTTALTGAMLSAAGLQARTCGNIGTPLIEVIDEDTPESVYAVELSSFQLEGIISLHPAAAVLVNLSPDHLDRYADYTAYVAAKARIFANQDRDDVAVLNASDADSRLVRSAIRAPVRLFSSHAPVEDGAFVRKDELVLAGGGRVDSLVALGDVPLLGRHNLENILAAALAAVHLGAPVDAVRRAIAGFRALPHRLEPVGRIDGVDYFNDSKATNVASCIKALEALAGRRIFVILGGRDKGGDFTALRPLLSDRAAAVLLIGEAAPAIAEQLAGAVPLVRAGELATAVNDARSSARPGDVVLLAPGCASFDQYRNYEERGEHFRALVRSLSGTGGAGGRGASAGGVN